MSARYKTRLAENPEPAAISGHDKFVSALVTVE